MVSRRLSNFALLPLLPGVHQPKHNDRYSSKAASDFVSVSDDTGPEDLKGPEDTTTGTGLPIDTDSTVFTKPERAYTPYFAEARAIDVSGRYEFKFTAEVLLVPPMCSTPRKRRHPLPMPGLKTLDSRKDAEVWITRTETRLHGAAAVHVRQIQWVVEPKYDGVTVRVSYERTGDDGKYVLVEAVTRGDGEEGLDVTRHALLGCIEGLPHIFTLHDCNNRGGSSGERRKQERPPRRVDVLGEVILRAPDLDQVNEQAEAAGKRPLRTCRAAAAAALQAPDPEVCRRTRLDFVAYGALVPVEATEAAEAADVGRDGGVGAEEEEEDRANAEAASREVVFTHMHARHSDTRWWLQSARFGVSRDVELCWDQEGALRAAERWMDTQELLDYEAEGVVIKLNETRLYGAAMRGSTAPGGGGGGGPYGSDATAPSWAAVWRFSEKQRLARRPGAAEAAAAEAEERAKSGGGGGVRPPTIRVVHEPTPADAPAAAAPAAGGASAKKQASAAAARGTAKAPKAGEAAAPTAVAAEAPEEAKRAEAEAVPDAAAAAAAAAEVTEKAAPAAAVPEDMEEPLVTSASGPEAAAVPAATQAPPAAANLASENSGLSDLPTAVKAAPATAAPPTAAAPLPPTDPPGAAPAPPPPKAARASAASATPTGPSAAVPAPAPPTPKAIPVAAAPAPPPPPPPPPKAAPVVAATAARKSGSTVSGSAASCGFSLAGVSGLTVCVTGRMKSPDGKSITRQQMKELLQRHGAELHEGVKRGTQVLVVGSAPGAADQAKAAKLAEAGQAIAVLTEAEFWSKYGSSDGGGGADPDGTGDADGGEEAGGDGGGDAGAGVGSGRTRRARARVGRRRVVAAV